MKPIHLFFLLSLFLSSFTQAEIRELLFEKPKGQLTESFEIFHGRDNPVIESVQVFYNNGLGITTERFSRLKINFTNRDSIVVSDIKSFEENQYFATINNFWLFKRSLVILNIDFNDFRSMAIDIKLQVKNTSRNPTYESLDQAGYVSWQGVLAEELVNPIAQSIEIQHYDRTLKLDLFKYISTDPSTGQYAFKVNVSEKEAATRTVYLPYNQSEHWQSLLSANASKIYEYAVSADMNGNRWVESINVETSWSDGVLNLIDNETYQINTFL